MTRTGTTTRSGTTRRGPPPPPPPTPPLPPPASLSASETRFETTRLFSTKNDLPETSRRQAVGLLNQRLAECIDLQAQCKQAHWNVKGPTFIALHKLFDEINEDVEDYVDLIAERIVQLGGVAEGTVGVVADRSTLVDYPLALSTGAEHVAALSDALAMFGRTVRVEHGERVRQRGHVLGAGRERGIDEMNDLQDADSADILTEISRGVDKWLWFVEAHQQGA